MGSHSPYSINYADPPKWRPGEDIAAGAFVGITLFLFVEVNVLIFRAFKKRKGLYYWSMQTGSLGILMRSVGIILKCFGSPSTDPIWPLYTLFNLAGWALYTTAQSLRYVFRMILSTLFIFIIPGFVLAWPSYNTSDHEMASMWSPRNAISDRYLQIGYTITESVISGLYIWSLAQLLRLKPNVRRRRVMMDLIYVNVIVIAFDVLSVVFIYTNQSALSHPIQTFSYILKLRLEFVVLNQLMDLAARGVRRETFRRNRYFRTANRDGNTPSQETKTSNPGQAIEKSLSKDPAQTTLPSSMPLSDFTSFPKSSYQARPTNRLGSDVQTARLELEPDSNSFDHAGIADRRRFSSDGDRLTQTAGQEVGCQPPPASRGFKHWPLGRSKYTKPLALRQGDHSHRRNFGDKEDEEEEEEEEEDIDLHMWDRGGAMVLEVPWFRSKVDV